ncbi:MAG: response regulator [Verrucomicrobiota bacterium]
MSAASPVSAAPEKTATSAVANCIAIVEDEPLVASHIRAVLQTLGYRVPDAASTAKQAFDTVARYQPSLVLVDINLAQNDDGIALAGELRQRFGVPVIFITALADEETLARAKSVEPYGYLLKPFNEQELQSAVEVALSRSQTQNMLQESRETFASTLRSIADGVIATNLVGNVTFMNPLAEELTGWKMVEAVGRPLREVFGITLESGEEASYMPHRNEEGNWEPRRFFLTRRDGEIIPIEDTSAPVKDGTGSLTGLVVVFRKRDLVSPEEAENLNTESSRLVGIVEGISDPLVAVDVNWQITFVNSQAAHYFDQSPDAMTGTDLWEAFPDSVHERYYNEYFQALENREQRNFEVHAEETNTWFEVTAYPFGDGLLMLLKDVSDKRQDELRLRKVEQLESLGLLARGFAHEFNNLLTVLLGNVSLAQIKIPADADGRPEVDAAKKATLQAQNRVQQLLTFAKGGAPVKERIEIPDAIREWFEHRDRRDNVNYHFSVPDSLWPANADRNQFVRLLENLFANAEQSFGRDGGRIEIRVANAPDTHELRQQFPEALSLEDSAQYILFRISDDGPGIPRENLKKVFEPYFSTRQAENATGIGLTVCESIVRAHDGGIALESEEGKGTTITIALPAHIPFASGSQATSKNVAILESESTTSDSSPVNEEPESPPMPTPEESRTPRILLLEDEALIRQLMRMNLVAAGYDVDETEEGSQTVERFRDAFENNQAYDLVIMDLSIPNGMGGSKAMQAVRSIDPNVRSIVSSGYSDDPAMANPGAFGFDAVLPKPYQPDQLTKLVESLLST